MVIYNVTLILDEGTEHEWLQWMKETHIPDVMATGCFIDKQMLKVTDSPNEGATYCMQYTARTMEAYEDYRQNFAPRLQESLNTQFAGKFVAYRSLMEQIEC